MFCFAPQVVEQVADGLANSGYAIVQDAVDRSLRERMLADLCAMRDSLRPAGVGRGLDLKVDTAVRSDSIFWIEPDLPVRQEWLNACDDLRIQLNRQLMLGLQLFECHYANYQPGQFYARHVDAFRGQKNRVLSLVTYLNEDWKSADGGELLLYGQASQSDCVTASQAPLRASVLPEAGTLVVFLSEEFPHEVCPAQRERFSIAGWFRQNATALI